MKVRKKGVINKFYIALIIFISMIFSTINSSVYALSNDELLDEARNIIKNYYVQEVPQEILNKPTIDSMVNALNDPYSEYFTKQKNENFVNTINNTFYGIGIYKEKVEDGIKITSVIENSPAEEAKLQSGDIIIKADDRELKGMSDEESAKYLKGSDGSIVKLLVKRNNETLEFNVRRGQVAIPTVQGKIFDKDIAYIRITSFGQDTAALFSNKLQELENQKPSKYIVDLRGNGGGYMSAALDIAGHFIPNKPAIIVENRKGEKVKYKAPIYLANIDKPTIFLTNENSASASEILSAAIKDYDKAFFVGKNTYGKGVAQNLFKLSDESVIKLTVEKFYSPNGKEINKKGIAPNFEVKDDDLDSLKVAELLYGNSSNNENKKGFLKVNIDGKSFEINLEKARSKDYINEFKYIMSKLKDSDISIGTEKSWQKITESGFFNKNTAIYVDYVVGDTLKDIPVDKKFSVEFYEDLEETTVKEGNFKIIEYETGKLIPVKIEKVQGTFVIVSPKENLKKGVTYYFVVDGDIKAKSGNVTLKNQHIIKVVVAK